MKALTIRQPWAWLITHGPKRIENREWGTAYRGPLLIHAAKGMTRAELWQAQMFVDSFDEDLTHRIPTSLARGAIVGVAELVDIIEPDSPCPDEWYTGGFGWMLANVRALTDPIPFKGALGLWTPPAEVVALVRCWMSGGERP